MPTTFTREFSVFGQAVSGVRTGIRIKGRFVGPQLPAKCYGEAGQPNAWPAGESIKFGSFSCSSPCRINIFTFTLKIVIGLCYNNNVYCPACLPDNSAGHGQALIGPADTESFNG